MTDTLTKEQRKRCMAAVRGKDTKPELVVRSLLHRMGYRFRLHRKDLPGNPDIVLPGRHKVIFVHGCFWHQHVNCKYATRPQTRSDFWNLKLDKNVLRDKQVQNKLRRLGWGVMVVWECQLHNTRYLSKRLFNFLDKSTVSQ